MLSISRRGVNRGELHVIDFRSTLEKIDHLATLKTNAGYSDLDLRLATGYLSIHGSSTILYLSLLLFRLWRAVDAEPHPDTGSLIQA